MLKKKFLKTKCKVTFGLPDSLAEGVDRAYLVGDFNNWDEYATPLMKNKSNFSVSLDLDLDKDYEFRYLVNEASWHNDWHADRYAPNPFHGDNSVVTTYNTDRNAINNA